MRARAVARSLASSWVWPATSMWESSHMERALLLMLVRLTFGGLLGLTFTGEVLVGFRSLREGAIRGSPDRGDGLGCQAPGPLEGSGDRGYAPPHLGVAGP